MINYTTRKAIFENNFKNNTKILKNILPTSLFYKVLEVKEIKNAYLMNVKSETISCRCRHCNKVSTKYHDNKVVYPLVGTLNGKAIIMKVQKKRFKCFNCDKTFVEPTYDIRFKAQISNTIRENLFSHIVTGQTYTSSSKLNNISINSAINIFDKYRIKSTRYTKVRNILIDELRLLSNKKKFQFVIIDADTREMLDILETRNQKDVYNYLLDKFEVGDLETVTMDLWNPYRRAVYKFNQVTGKNIIVIADKFHFIRQIMWDLDSIRIEEFEKFPVNSKEYKTIKHCSKLLRMRRDKLSTKGLLRLEEAFKLSKRLYIAYQFKESYLDLVKTCTSKEKFIEEIDQWLQILANANLKGFKRTISSHNNWKDEISNAFAYKYSNGYIEGANQKMKLAKNKAFGFRNLQRTEKLMQLQIGKRRVI